MAGTSDNAPRWAVRPNDGQMTLKAEAFPFSPSEEINAIVERHRRTAQRLLAEGHPTRAFGELVRASRALPMSPRLAASLVTVALLSGMEPAAITLLSGSLVELEGAEKHAVRRQLVRVLRRVKEFGRARKVLEDILAESASDARARRQLHLLLEKDQKWEELERTLEKSVKDAVKRKDLRTAAMDLAQRARVAHVQLGQLARAALRWGQAAQYYEQAGLLRDAWSARRSWLEALHGSRAPAPAMEAAEEVVVALAERVGRVTEARALFQSLGLSYPNPEKERRPSAAEREEPIALEMRLHTLAVRGAWKELAAALRERASSTAHVSSKADWLARLSELLEFELQDLDESARLARTVATLTEDLSDRERALRLRLLSEQRLQSRDSLDAQVDSAREGRQRVEALLARAAALGRAGQFAPARMDYAEVLRLKPNLAEAQVGLAEVSARVGDARMVGELLDWARAMGEGTGERTAMLRRVARLAERVLPDHKLARRAWTEVGRELQTDDEARTRLVMLARRNEDTVELVALLEAFLQVDPEGRLPRRWRLELAAVLELEGKRDRAFSVLKAAVKAEPAHVEAWVALFVRCSERGLNDEAARALEQAASHLTHPTERSAFYAKLARFWRDVLGDHAKAARYASRSRPDVPAMAEVDVEITLPMALLPDEEAFLLPPPPPPPRSVARPAMPLLNPTPARAPGPRRRSTGEHTQPAAEAPQQAASRKSNLRLEAQTPSGARMLPEGTVSRIVAPATLQRMEERGRLTQRVKTHPLDPRGYDSLGRLFEGVDDVARASLMFEVSAALRGELDAPATPRLVLSASDRAGLRHPVLRNDAGELLSLAAPSLLQLALPKPKREALVEFRLDSGKGAPVLAEALLAAVRILGLRAPELAVGTHAEPPMLVRYLNPARLCVSRAAVKRPVSLAEARFFAGRALFAATPEILLLTSVSADQLDEALEGLAALLPSDRRTGSAHRALAEGWSTRVRSRMKTLHAQAAGHVHFDTMGPAALHSMNRAGLLVCGGVTPAIEALRNYGGSAQELAELARFASSERYLKLRSRVIPK